MKRLGAVVVLLAVVLGSCGGESEPSSAADPSPDPTGMDMAAACEQVKASTEEIGGPGALGAWAVPTFRDYAADLNEIADKSEPDAADSIRALAEQSATVGEIDIDDESVSMEDLTSEWASRYVALQDACADAGSPIRRLT